MSAFLSNWLPRQVRTGLCTFALLALCITATVVSRPSLTTFVAASRPATSALEAPAAAIWPHTIFHLWILIPQLLPRHDR